MSEMLRGLLACVGAAVFFVAMVAAMKSTFRGVASSVDGEQSGAPEGDQVHFQIVGESAGRK